jgi:SecD/SecF fusion protein
MQPSLTRTILIWAVIAASAFYVVPTIGWLFLSQEARAERLARWEEEDTARAKDRPGQFQRLVNNVKRWTEFDRDRVINLGLDLQGGVHTVVSFDWHALGEERIKQYRDSGYTDSDIEREVQQTVLQQITRRVNDFEAKEPIIQTLGSNQIQIQLPGEQNVDRAVALIKKTAQLNFHIVAGPDETVPVFTKIRDTYPEDFKAFIERPVPGRSGFRVQAENFERVKDLLARVEQRGGIVPADKVILFSQPPRPFEEQVYSLYLVDKQPIASGEGLTRAGATPDQMNPPYWQIHFMFNSEAAAGFGQATQANIGRPMAIVLDDMVVSAPVIRDRISDSGQITGNFAGEEARDLAIALNSGSMVVPVKEEFTRKVSASLGAESIRHGVISAVAGVLAVGFFMMIYYTGGGLVAVISQALNGLFVVALMAYFNMTLTLPGIAGLILTIGMAVDANVLIYERIREEMRLGHSFKAAVESGFARASVAILDANVTTLIAAIVLFQFGTGAIQGFAITLSIGVVTSVFSALVISRAMLDFAIAKNLMTRMPMLQIVKPDFRYDFMAKRVPAAGISIALVVLGMGWFLVRGEDNFGVDFRQGTNIVMQLRNDEAISPDAVREALSQAGFGNPVVQGSDSGEGAVSEFLIRVSDIAGDEEGAADTTVAERMKQTLAPLTGSQQVADVSVVNEQTVGPAVGAQLRWDALQALFYAHLFIVLYLAFRFELKFAVGAIVAIVHDVLISVGLYSVLGGEISLNVVAAVLTIVGYSLNDTIVIFDRIREDMKLHRGKGYTLGEIINLAVSETFGRTLLTNLLTTFVVVVLYLFGGPAIDDFALCLLIGMFAGTYSTVFIASPVVYFWQEYVDKRRGAADAAKNEGNRRNPRNPKKKTEPATT